MIRKVNVLGFNSYVREAHPKEYERNLREYANYSNWLDPKFLKLGHVYKTTNYDKFTKVLVLDGFKPVLNDSLKLTYTYLVHFSSYKEYETEEDNIGWVTLDQAYKLMLEDITGTKDVFGKIIEPVEVKEQPYCEYDHRIVLEDESKIEILFTKFQHHSYIDYSSERNEKYNRHNCSLRYKRYVYEMIDGEWTKVYTSHKNTIRLAADNNMGWCHDTGIDSLYNSKYDGCFKKLRECKKKFLGVESLAKCPVLFDDIKTLSTEMFVPYPIVNSEW